MGTNTIAMSLTENGSAITTIGTAVEEEYGWFFEFLGIDSEAEV